MSLFDLFRKTPRETRAEDPSWNALQTFGAPSTALVHPHMAEGLATITAIVGAISGTISAMPAYLYRMTDKGRDVDQNHPLALLIRNGPNEHQNWPEFVEWLVAQTLLRGNGLAELVTDRDGRVIALKPIPWEWVSVQLLPNGRLAYDVTEHIGMHGATGRVRRLLEDQVFHLRDRTDDGLVGRSRLHRAAAVINQAVGIQEASNAVWRNGLNPSGVFEIDGQIGEEALKQIKASLKSYHQGATNTAKAMVLQSGMRWKQMSVSPEDAEVLASRRFTTEELARLYNVPPPLIGDLTNGTFTNSETAGRWFAQHTLTPWVRKIECEFAKSVLSEEDRRTYSLEIDLSGLMRGDHQARWEGHEIAVRNKILLPNEIREVEGWNPREGGDEFPEDREGANAG